MFSTGKECTVKHRFHNNGQEKGPRIQSKSVQQLVGQYEEDSHITISQFNSYQCFLTLFIFH